MMLDKPLRETQPVRALGVFTGVWAVLFSINLLILGDTLTSKQWQYLMSFPGGKWFWGVSFMISGALILYGWHRNHYTMIGAGFFLAGFLCSAIAVFYWIAPLLGPNLLTLGPWPWAFATGILWGGAAVNWGKRSW